MEELKVALNIEKIETNQFAVKIEAGDFKAIEYYDTTNTLFCLYKSLMLALYNSREKALNVEVNSAAFAYDLKHIDDNKQRLSLMLKQTLRRTKTTINSVSITKQKQHSEKGIDYR